MPAIQIAFPEDDYDFASMSIPELRDMLDQVLGLSVKGLYLAAHIMRELERKGDDVSDIVLSFRHHLRRIASGQMLPDVMLKFAGREILTTKISYLAIEEQQRLVDGGRVSVWGFLPGGEWTESVQDPTALTPAQIRQVFAADHLRNQAEQRNWLASLREKQARPIPSEVAGWIIDEERGGAYLGRKFVPAADLIAVAKVLQSLRK